jgi:type III restriction enzyme
MALHPDFPTSPYAPLRPEQRCFPADETMRATAYEKLLPPLIAWSYRPYLASAKSIFTKTVGEPRSGGFELRFAAFLEEAADVAAFAKNYFAVGFKLDCVRANGDLSNYTPDFIVRTGDAAIWIVETKGRAELDVPQKMERLKQWCADATAAEAAGGGSPGQRYDFVFVDQNGFEKHAPKTLAALAASFTEYKT